MKKPLYLYWFCILVMISNGACSKTDDGSSIVGPDGPGKEEPAAKQYVANWNMEEDIDLTKTETAEAGRWCYLGGWMESAAKVSQEPLRGVNGSRCVAIIAQQDVDVMLAQKITGLDPKKPYKATARIKTENVLQGKGGHICLDYLWAPASEGVTGTKDWTTVTLEIDEVPDDGSLVLCLRLGSTSNSSQGVAYFDNVSLQENTNLYIQESEHVRLMIDKKYVSISETQITEWLQKLDQVYEAYVELFSGRKPFEGKITTLRSGAIDAWAYAGNPVMWNQDYISSSLLTVAKGDWCFGIMHELGHNFAPYISNATYSFNWNEEVMANFRMYYALEKLNGMVITDANILQPDGSTKTETKTYVGTEIKQLYKSETTNCYDRTIAINQPVEMGNALCYKLIQIKEKYGWDLYRKAFDELYGIPRNTTEEESMTQWDKFDYFMSILTKHAGEDIYANNFTSAELNTIKTYLQTQK